MWSAGICCRFDRHCDVQVTERPVEELQWRFSGLTLHTVPSERLFHPGICADHDQSRVARLFEFGEKIVDDSGEPESFNGRRRGLVVAHSADCRERCNSHHHGTDHDQKRCGRARRHCCPWLQRHDCRIAHVGQADRRRLFLRREFRTRLPKLHEHDEERDQHQGRSDPGPPLWCLPSSPAPSAREYEPDHYHGHHRPGHQWDDLSECLRIERQLRIDRCTGNAPGTDRHNREEGEEDQNEHHRCPARNRLRWLLAHAHSVPGNITCRSSVIVNSHQSSVISHQSTASSSQQPAASPSCHARPAILFSQGSKASSAPP